jgi:hypothetical protein
MRANVLIFKCVGENFRTMRSVRPNAFRTEFIKYSYNQIMKTKKLEKKIEEESALVNEQLKNFSNEAVDDPYKVKKIATATMPSNSKSSRVRLSLTKLSQNNKSAESYPSKPNND